MTQIKSDKITEDEQKIAQRLYSQLPLLGQISWLMLNSPKHKHLFVADLEWSVIPPLLLGQSKLYVKDNLPMAYICWANISDNVKDRILNDNTRLAPHEWNSGKTTIIIDSISPYTPFDNIIKNLQENELKDKKIHKINFDINSKISSLEVINI